MKTSLELNIACHSRSIWPWERIEPPSFDLNAEPLDSLDVDERPQPITKLAYSQHHAQLLATFFMTTH